MKTLTRAEMRKRIIKAIRATIKENILEEDAQKIHIMGLANSLLLLEIITFASWERLYRVTKT